MTRYTKVATDGSSLGNPGPGGWAFITEDGQFEVGSQSHTTNNRMELEGVRQALLHLQGPLHLFCDSQYVVNIFTQWLPQWKRNGMKKSNKQPVLNTDLILEIEALLRDREIIWEWVKGHDGHTLNEMADTLASAAAETV